MSFKAPCPNCGKPCTEAHRDGDYWICPECCDTAPDPVAGPAANALMEWREYQHPDPTLPQAFHGGWEKCQEHGHDEATPLRKENQILRDTIAGVLVKAKVIPQESLRTPWSTEALLRLVGMYLNDELAWVSGGPTHRAIAGALNNLERRVGEDRTTLIELRETLKELITDVAPLIETFAKGDPVAAVLYEVVGQISGSAGSPFSREMTVEWLGKLGSLGKAGS